MTMLLTIIAQYAVAHGAGLMPKIIFWLLLILWAISAIPKWENESVVKGGAVIQIILFAILGYYLFGF
jgi:hypothetical protein